MRTETLEIGCYALAVGLLGLLFWEGYNNKNTPWQHGPKNKKAWLELRDKLRKQADAIQPDREQWSYTQQHKEWWATIKSANLIGKKPEKKEEDEGKTGPEEKVTEAPKVVEPIGDILELTTVLAGDGVARIKVRYKRGVESPEAAPSAVPMDVTAGGAVASSSVGQPFHDLQAGEALYKPFDYIKFKGIDFVDAAAVFVQPNPNYKGKEGEEKDENGEKKTVEQKLHLFEVGLSEEFVEGGTAKAIGAQQRASTKSSKRERKWKNPGDKSAEVEPNVWMISQKDSANIERDYNRLLTEDFQTDDYVGRPLRVGGKRGKKGERIRGVSFKRVSQNAARFGIKSGDVLIKVNGEKVTSRANAIKVGKAQHQRGIRTFELTFWSSGREVVRTYRAPDKKK